MNNLLKQYCRPCEGGMPQLTLKVAKLMMKQISKKWRLTGGGKKIEADFKFKDFAEAMEFVNKVAALAEREGHHPNIFVHGWNKVRLTLSTHAIGGLSNNDFVMAAKIEAKL